MNVENERGSAIAAAIAAIVDERRTRADALESRFANAAARAAALETLGEVAASTASTLDEATRPLAEELATHARQAAAALRQTRTDVDRLTQRWRKGLVTVGVAGVAKMGKSTLLQSISGLPNDLIPADSGVPLTGARSRIVSRPGGGRATVRFLSRDEFLRTVVGGFYRDLGFGGHPTWSEFLNSLPPLPPESSARERTNYGSLKSIQAKAPQVAEYLDAPPREIPHSDVRGYILKRDGDRELAAYLAVREVELHTPFPSVTSPHVSVIDLPGLGDLTMDFAQTLLDTTRQEVDVVIYVKMPSETGDQWSETDVRVFDTVERALAPKPLADAMHILLNDNGTNGEIIGKLSASPPEACAGCDLTATSARDARRVHEELFHPLLQRLAQRLPTLDRAAAEGVGVDAERAISATAAAWAELKPRLVSGGRDGAVQFNPLKRAFLEDLKNQLEEMLDEYRPDGRAADEAVTIRMQVEAACRESVAAARNEFPGDLTPESLLRAERSRGAWEPVATDAMHAQRAAFSNTLSTELQRRLTIIADGVRRSLVERLRQTKLDNVFGPGLDPRAVLTTMADHADEAGCEKIAGGMRFLAGFTFGYQDSLHPGVRKHLSRLDPRSARRTQQDLAAANLTEKAPEAAATVVLNFLENCQREAAAEVAKELRGAEDRVPWAVFAALEEFNDRLIRSHGHEDEWDRLLEPRRHVIWPEQYADIAAAVETEARLTTAADAALAA